MAINKVIYGGTTLIDITDTTAVAAKVLDGYYFYGRDGVKTEGSCTFDADTSSATATADDILYGETAVVNGNTITGSMPNRGAISATISSLTSYTVQNGYHDGSGTVSIDGIEKAKIIAGNIKKGVQILGVTGNYEGTDQIKAVAGSGTPSASAQTILPSSAGNDERGQGIFETVCY